jgi:hypothetical protein
MISDSCTGLTEYLLKPPFIIGSPVPPTAGVSSVVVVVGVSVVVVVGVVSVSWANIKPEFKIRPNKTTLNFLIIFLFNFIN